FGCSNSGITDAARLLFLNAHNEARLSVAQGLEPNKCGLLGPAKNMYKLQWDCDLEQQAQSYISNCPSALGSFSGYSQNLIRYTGIFTNPLSNVAAAVNGWWSAVRKYGSTDPDNKYVNSKTSKQFGLLYGSTFQMVHGKTTGIGCAYKVCPLTLYLTVTCLYNKIGYYTNGVMWENGAPCTSAADCTTYAGSTCSGGLCVKELEESGRSRVANGLEPDALGGNAPKASQMLKMLVTSKIHRGPNSIKVYDCDVEASAIQHSRKCVYEHSASTDRPGLGENLYMTSALNVDKVTTAAENPFSSLFQSSQLWWDELKDY
ncbi:unnamed protein product, partial [Strongylus vulgaris]